MSNSGRRALAAIIAVVVIIGAIATAFSLGSSFSRSSDIQELSALQSTIASLKSTTTLITPTVTTVVTSTRFPNVPWDRVWFLTSPEGGNSAISFVGNFSKALLFDCVTASAQGCTVQVHSELASANFSITVWYPRLNQSNEPSWANCEYVAFVLPGGQPVPGGPGFAFCVPIGSNGFIVAEEAPPPA